MKPDMSRTGPNAGVLDAFTCYSLLAFAAVSLLVYLIYPAQLHVSGDTGGYLEPARAMIRGAGGASSLRLPGYPAMLAPFVAASGNPVPWVVAFQGVLLFATGLLARRTAQLLFNVDDRLVQLLATFNPVALFFMQRLLPEIPFAFLFMLHVFLLLKGIRSKSLPWLTAAALTVCVAAMTRANGIYLIPVSGMVTLILSGSLKRTALFLVAAAVFLGPFVGARCLETGTLSPASPRYVRYAMHENLLFLEQRSAGMVPLETARRSLYAKGAAHYGMSTEEWSRLDRSGQIDKIGSASMPLLLAKPLPGILRAMLSAEKVFFFDGGISWWSMVFGIDQQPFSAFFAELPDNLANLITFRWKELDSNFLLYAPLMALIFLLRATAVVGAGSMLCRGHVRQLTAIALYVLCVAATAAFLGNSRYRLPVDPLLFMLSTYGLGTLFRRKDQ